MLSLSCCSQDTFPAGIKIEKNVPMKKHTSFKVGGPADYFARPSSLSELIHLMRSVGSIRVGNMTTQRTCSSSDNNIMPCTIIGSGTNILVKDRGIRGLVISLVRMKNGIEMEDVDSGNVKVSASAGTILSSLCHKTIKLGLEDLSFAAGIPGTVGGAVMMNAGTGVGTISDRLVSIDILDEDGNIRTLYKGYKGQENAQLIFSHRKLEFASPFALPFKPTILRVSFLLTKGSRQKVEESWVALIKKRRASQPHGFPSAGCFFKNPDTAAAKHLVEADKPIVSAGQLIDMAGLKRKRVGDATVSDKHANFILNLGNATASEILTLKNIVKETVFEKFGVHLTEEVIIQGE